jgi:hypothetical protein
LLLVENVMTDPGYGRIEDVSGGIDGTGGGVLGPLLGGELPAMPENTPSVEVTPWPPTSWGPRLYEFDAAGNRSAVAAPGD